MLKITKDHALYRIENLCSITEDLLSALAIIPIIGTIPALMKVAFGIIQCTLALILMASSACFPNNSIANEVFIHSFRHLTHGLINTLTGLVQAIPLMGLYLACESLSNSIPSNITVYKNAQSHKFFAYKTVHDNSWYCRSDYDDYACSSIEYEDIAPKILEAKQSTDGLRSCVSLQPSSCVI